MTKEIREALLKASELRTKINTEQAKDEPNGESLETLRKQSLDAEKELREALAKDEDDESIAKTPDREERDRLELRSKSRFHRFVRAAVLGREVDGAEAEYADSLGCPGLVPLDLFETRSREERAVTPGPADADVNKTTARIVPAIFDRSVAPWLGIAMPTVGTGIQSFPVLSTSLTGGPKAEDAAAAETEGAFTVTDADPRRLTGSFKIRREDIAKLEGLEVALRQNLSSVLSDELDKQIVNGSGTAPHLNGILQQLTDPEAPASGADTFERYAAAFASHIDGLHAVQETDVRGLVGRHTLRHMASTFGGAAVRGDRSAAEYCRTSFGGVRATRRIADPASNIQQCIIRRSNPAGDRVAVAPVWSGLELIRDPYTEAGKGQIIVTGVMLVGGVVLLRSGAFVQDSFRLAA